MRSFAKVSISFYLVLIFCWAAPSHGSPYYTKHPVSFVHGYGMAAGSWASLITYLQQQSGYPSLFLKAIQLVSVDGSNIDAAEDQIAPAIEAFLKDVNEFLAQNHPDIPLKTKVDLISHSMGGLSSRWYTARVRPDRVRKWISLAGANHGTNDLCGWPGKGADDCCPAYASNPEKSFIQYELNGALEEADIDETPYGIGLDPPAVNTIPPDQNHRILYVTIRTIDDEWIDPDDSVILDGAGGVEIPIPTDLPAELTSAGNILMKNGVGHDPMLADPDTMRLVGIILGINYEITLNTWTDLLF